MSKFEEIHFYKPPSKDYSLLPFRFAHLDDDKVVVTNMVGEFHFVTTAVLQKLVHHSLDDGSQEYIDLRAKHFLTDGKTQIANRLLSIKARTRYKRLADFTTLHMFVVTLRCEHSCPYCQVSRQSDDRVAFDMSEETALASLKLAMKSPAPAIKIEFQGGESFLKFDLIKFIVLEALKNPNNKELSFVIATNLAVVTREMLEFCKAHSIGISTSLDGPRDLHNGNRPRPGGDSYEKTIEGIRLAREILGYHQVSALMTTSPKSLDRVKDIIDEYLDKGFGSIFLRPLSPYGFAIKTKSYLKYDAKRWFEFFKEGLEYIIELNRQGFEFREYYSAIVLTKMLTLRDPGYVDLTSPAGIGIGAVLYNYDGNVFASDESRMLAEMGVDKFKLGNVYDDTYEDIFFGDALLEPLEESFSYSAPMCNDCAFESYCGADPVYHYATGKDFLGRKPESDFCTRNMSVFKYLMKRFDEDEFVRNLFLEWAK